MSTAKRILLVRPDRIGDVVLATPLIRAIRDTFPNSYLSVMVRPYAGDVLLGNPHLNTILLDDPTGDHAGTSDFFRQVATLRKHRFDTALLLLPTRRHTWMAFFAGIPTRIGVGWRPYHALTFMRTVNRNQYRDLRHEADYCMDLGRRIGVHSANLSTEVFLTDEERADGRRRLEEANAGPFAGQILVGIHAGSGGSAPNWRPGRYVELARQLIDRFGVTVVLTGAPAEKGFAAHFAGTGERVIDMIGLPSLRDTAAVISQLSVLVSSSTGPMHIAAGLGVSTVSMFCRLPARRPELWGPLGNRSEIIMPPEGVCPGRCPGGAERCEFGEGVDVDVVAGRIASLLEKPVSG